MHERHRADRGFSSGTSRDGESTASSNRHPPDRGQLHKKIMGMLVIDEGTSVQAFSGLENFAVSLFSDRRRIEAQHRIERELR